MNPPDIVVEDALIEALRSPCRSKRGVALFDPRTSNIIATGHNGPPSNRPCPGREVCSGKCGQMSVHAEVRAIRWAMWMLGASRFTAGSLDLLHVEHGGSSQSGDRDLVKPCSGPSCWQCSREIADTPFIGGVWLYERTPDDWCPHLDSPRNHCTLCNGADCDLCHPGPGRPHCDHATDERHHGHPIVEARWRRYNSADFHRVTLQRCGLVSG